MSDTIYAMDEASGKDWSAEAPLFPGVDLGALPVQPENRCPLCGALIGLPAVTPAGERVHPPQECPLED